MHAAALNNAEWCDIVCRTHGLATTFRERAWTSAHRSPPMYPDAVTLSETATVDDVLPWIEVATPGASVKDSFARLDLRPAGFEVLFDASWIHRPADLPLPRPDPAVHWSTVDTVTGLAAWIQGEAPFRPELLAVDAVRVVGGWTDDRLVAGAILNRSDDVLGVSNVFSLDGATDTAWAGVLSVADRLFPGVAVVGYGRGEDLQAALRNGFRRAGALRVWYASAGR